MHSLAQDLNDTITKNSPAIFPLLSQRGREIFFPSQGILGQTAEAKGCQYNATIGIALDDDKMPMRLPSLDQYVSLEPQEVYPYASSYGLQPLREQWKAMMQTKNPSLQGTFSTPVITTGLTGALTVAGYLFTDPEEEILVTDKYWGNYNLIFQHGFGAVLKPFNTHTTDGFDAAALRSALSGPLTKRVVLLNFPNNPSGYTPTEAEAAEICAVLTDAAERAEQGLVVLLDDAYFGLVYEEGVYRESLFATLNQASEKLLVVKIDGATKEDYVWGHRVGCITFGCRGMTAAAAEALEAKAAGAVRGLFSNACHLSQSLLLHLYQSPSYQQEKQAKYDTLQARYQQVKQAVSRPEHQTFFTALPFNSGYFMCVALQQGIEAEQVRLALLKDHGVGVIATNGLLRIAYSCLPEADIDHVFASLYQVARSLSPTPYHALQRITAVA